MLFIFISQFPFANSFYFSAQAVDMDTFMQKNFMHKFMHKKCAGS